MKYLLGFDIGSSSVKAALLNAASGTIAASAFSPSSEMPIDSPEPGFAEQNADQWWHELIIALNKIKEQVHYQADEIIAIGISYQMHGLVCIDKYMQPLRPAIIWCDSRAVDIGNEAFEKLGEKFCLSHFLNSPGNFTASKLKWVKENEPGIYKQTYKALLPGDYIAMKLTGEIGTTISGLSEGIFWDFQKNNISADLLNFYGIDKNLLAPAFSTFGEQGRLNAEAAQLLGLRPGVPVTYRAGDQPNNAYSLNVLQPGEIAATAGTSGVVYGITDKVMYDKHSRLNTFVHVNHETDAPRYGILLCVNGTGSLNSWLRKTLFTGLSYDQINDIAANAPIGSDGLQFYPFGNGAERILLNKNPGAGLTGLQFNRHQRSHIARSAQEGIGFALHYGMEIMEQMGLTLKTIRAGYANMFLSDVFAKTLSNVSGCVIELYNTDGAAGAARAAGVGGKVYATIAESFTGMNIVKRIEPGKKGEQLQTKEAYQKWKINL